LGQKASAKTGTEKCARCRPGVEARIKLFAAGIGVVGPNQVRTLIHSKLVLGGGSLCALLVVLFATTGSAAARADNGRPTATMVAFEQAADGQATDGKDTRSAREKRRRPTEAEFEELTAAAQGGDAKAQCNLGMLYHNGGGKAHPRDYEEAMKWLRMAADQGHVEAEDRVGLMYYLGEGVRRIIWRRCAGIRRRRTRETPTRNGSSWICIRRGSEFRKIWKSPRGGRGWGNGRTMACCALDCGLVGRCLRRWLLRWDCLRCSFTS
jgi:TPR repeat protein